MSDLVLGGSKLKTSDDLDEQLNREYTVYMCG